MMTTGSCAMDFHINRDTTDEDCRGSVCTPHARAAGPGPADWHTRYGSARWSSTSKGIGIERSGATCAMLAERLVCETCQGLLRLTESSIPTLVARHFFKDGGSELVLLPFRETAGDLEGLPQCITHLCSHVGKSITEDRIRRGPGSPREGGPSGRSVGGPNLKVNVASCGHSSRLRLNIGTVTPRPSGWRL